MAKEETKKLTPEEEQAEKDRLARLKKEEKELKQKLKEKEKRRKERERKIRAKERKEERRIRKIVNFPFKTLTQVTMFLTSVAFMAIYFGAGVDLEKAFYICFMLFILLYFTVGAVMVVSYWKISDERIKDMELKKKKEKEEEEERLRREEEELERLLKHEFEDISDDYQQDSKLLDKSNKEDEFLADMDFGALDDEHSSDANDEKQNLSEDNSDEFDFENVRSSGNTESLPPANEEPEPFFNENDFMNEVLFGTSEEKK